MTKEERNELMEIETLREPMAIGNVFAQSGLFPDVKTQAQAAVKILAGKELGLSPFQSMKDIYIVAGKLALQSNALAALVKSSVKYDYHVDVITNEECKITFFDKTKETKEVVGVSEFTFKDAAKAGLVNKDSWKSFPRNMLFARALANGVRFYCPDCAIGWHVQEEVTDLLPETRNETITITADGKVVNDGETKTDV
jgi:hypothetical protein